jgi:CHAD domain-containing protein
MAFRARPDESLARELSRLSTKQLASAREELTRTRQPDKRAIHEARKRVKKARAILDVIKRDSGRGLSGARKRLRSVNRALSRVRDADAMAETLSKLVLREPQLLSEHTRERLRRQLSSHRDAVVKTAAGKDKWRDLLDVLRGLEKASKRWSSAHRQFGALEPGLRAVHKRGRTALEVALERRRAVDFHEWRKQIKALWYQLRLIEDAGAIIERHVKALERAQDALGDDHNVTVLFAYLSSTHSSAYDSAELQRFFRSAEQYQQQLRRSAIAAASTIYRPSSRAFVQRIRRVWQTRARKAA